ncbi:hypothetical protein P389DRAFT_157250 [Cystobasidium minutum MCA 4210]|uniref:uncharacterized protein n=1 Tax=Cystobasidium minutum MCA 4210 TaxID=1397322 RepID=UPI0034CE57F2|eukprot:jgi/Rhomi1/157250/estExt_Genewise1Plus.C_1_t20476
MPADKRTVLWSAATLLAAAVALSPHRLVTLLLSPLFVVGVLVTALVIQVALAYCADHIAASRRSRANNSKNRYDPIVPLLSIATPAGLEAIKTKRAWAKSNTSFRQPLHPTSATASAALDELIATILDNHLLSWYTVSISPSDPSFPNAVEKTIRDVLVGIRGRVADVDWAKLGVSTILPKITTHLDLFLEAQQSLMESSDPNVKSKSGDHGHKSRGKKQSPGATVASEELDLLLANKYAELAGQKGLHPAVSGASFNSRPSEEKHLRSLVLRILKLVMPAREAASSAVMTMAMEIVACAIIRPVIEVLSDPDLWNKMIDDKAGAIIREQRMVTKLREALDAAPNIPQTPISSASKQSGAISVKSTTKEFEAFLKSLSRCPNLLEGKRLRNDIEANLRRTRLPNAFEDCSPDALSRYIERLTTARQVIDKRIGELGGQKAPAKMSPPALTGPLALRDILHQPGAMSFFMEFMDRRNRVMLTQFYLTIEGLKDPLEEEELNEDELGQSASSNGDVQVDARVAQALRDDVQLLLSTFLVPKTVTISASITEALIAFQKQEGPKTGQNISKALYRSTKRRIFAAQAQAYEEMNEFDWPAFQRSDLYNKAAAEMPMPTLYSSRNGIARQTSTRRPRAMSSEPEIILPSSFSTRSADAGNLETNRQRVAFGRSATSQRSVSGDTGLKAGQSTAFKADKIDFLTGASTSSNGAQAAERSPLFDDDPTPLDVTAGQGGNLDDAETVEQQRTMHAIQEALTSILEDDTRRRSFTVPGSPVSNKSRDSVEPSPARQQLLKRATSPILKLNANGTSPVLDTKATRQLLHGRAASYHSQGEDQGTGAGHDDKMSDDEEMASSVLRLAAPGNLQLPAEIVKITDRIEKLKNQEGVLAALLRKAELTGSTDETKILLKSIDALRREVSELSFQKRQFEAQADENKLIPGRTSVDIIGTTVGQSEGKDFALYLVEVRQLADDGKTQISGWLVTRRFSEFVALHSTLKEKLPAVKALELPQKRLVTSMSNSLLQQRRQGLGKYLQALIKMPGALGDRDVRAFLSQQNISLLQPSSNNVISMLGSDMFPGQGAIRNLFRTVTSGMDDMFGGPSMLDAIILRLSQQAADFAGSITPSVQSEDLISSILGGFSGSQPGRSTRAGEDQVDLLSLSSDLQPIDGEGLTSFTAPIANFLVEVFDLKEKGSWLRRQAIVIILQQVLGGTIERKVREAVTLSTSGDALAPHIYMLKEMMWPDGKMRPPSLPRSAEEKLQTREAAFRKLTYLMPDVAASLIGRSNARRGARRVFAMMQNRRLLQHLIYTLLDDVICEVFGPAVKGEDK